jgi:hypothetical protein
MGPSWLAPLRRLVTFHVRIAEPATLALLARRRKLRTPPRRSRLQIEGARGVLGTPEKQGTEITSASTESSRR